MRLPAPLSRFLPAFVLALLFAANVAQAAANHVVISEFATRGPTAATDEFVELYNPTNAPIDISGWKLQYKSATGTTWNDRGVLPANTFIAAHGYFLIANQSYIGAVTPDFSSGAWNSGTGMADNGHERIIDASAVEVDLVGWGTAIAPEGTAAPNHGTSANSLSVERKALATSTADSLFTGGAHALLGNGQDTNVNSADYVVQTHGRNPQNAGGAIEPAFASGGNGTGRVTVSPTVVYGDHALPALTFSFAQDSAYTIAKLSIAIPPTWTWSHSPASVTLQGAAFASATASVNGDTVIVDGATLSTANTGDVVIADLTTPASKGTSAYHVRSAVAAGTLTPISSQPSTRVLELVPISVVHVNDANGVAAAPYTVGSEATITGIVTANLSTTRTDVYVQDETGGINLFNAAISPVTFDVGDSVTVTGNILQFRGLTEVNVDFNLIVKHATGRPVPAPAVVTCAGVNATFHIDGTEPNEGRLIRIDGCSYNPTTSTITDPSGTTNIFVPASWPTPPSVFDVIGILKQFKPGTPAPGPPYTADYEISPRTQDDIIPHPGPVLVGTPYEDHIQPTSVQIHWTTDVASTSTVRYGTTTAYGDSATDGALVTAHTITLTGLSPATVYHYSVGSTDVNGTNFSADLLFSTASAPASTGTVNVYFNKSVNTSLATIHPANGNADFTSLLVNRIDNAKRSIDAAVYNLSGTPGTTLANALIAAKNRGVQVRVVCEYDNSTAAGFTALTGAGVPLITDRFDPVNFGLGLMHDKFFVIDGRGGAPESVWVWTGSWNPTDPGTNNDMQNVIELQDQALGNVFTLEFQEMWGSTTQTPNASASRMGARKLDDTPHKFVVGGRSVECFFSPSDGTDFEIQSAINSAQHSLGFMLLTMTRANLATALIAQKNAGLKVRGALDSSSDSGSEYSTLVTGGVDVLLKSNASGLLHHKYLIGDAENPTWNGFVVTGSHNWSSSAENSNNENTLIVHDADIANQYLQEFAARYYQFGGTDSLHVTDVAGGRSGMLSLAQNWPNPFRGATQIAFVLPAAQHVKLRLFDVQGREVRTLFDGPREAGRHQMTIESRGLPAGMYLCRIEAGGVTQQKKMLVLK